jgi:hypothetical protein
MVKDSAAHCTVVFFSPIVVASGYFGFMLVTISDGNVLKKLLYRLYLLSLS